MASQTTRVLLGALLAVALTACTTLYRNHGYVPEQEELDAIVIGVDTQASVATAIGQPTSSGVLADEAWYYVGSTYALRGGRKPQEIERQVVAISFDTDGVVRNIERFGLEDGRVITLSRRVTDSNIQGVGLLRQLLGNIGQLSPAAFRDN